MAEKDFTERGQPVRDESDPQMGRISESILGMTSNITDFKDESGQFNEQLLTSSIDNLSVSQDQLEALETNNDLLLDTGSAIENLNESILALKNISPTPADNSKQEDLLEDIADSLSGEDTAENVASGLPGVTPEPDEGEAEESTSGFFGSIFAGASRIFSKVIGKSKFFGKISAGFGKFFSKFAFLGKFAARATKFAKFIPGVGLVISGVIGLFDAVRGFFNASEISGKSEELLTLGDKVQAAISSFISGITFGLVGPESVFSTIDKGITFFKETFGDIFSGEGLFGKITNGLRSLADLNPLDLLPDSVKEIGGSIGDSIRGFFSGDDKVEVESASPDVAPPPSIVRAQPISEPVRVDTNETVRMSKLRFEERQSEQNQTPAEPIIIQAPAPQITLPPVESKTSLNDFSLMSMNSLTFE